MRRMLAVAMLISAGLGSTVPARADEVNRLNQCATRAADLRAVSERLYGLADHLSSHEFILGVARVDAAAWHEDFPFLPTADLKAAQDASATVVQMGRAEARLLLQLAGHYDDLAAKLRRCR